MQTSRQPLENQPDPLVERLAQALADPDPAAALTAFEALAQSRVGARLFTISAYHAPSREYGRVWTNMPDVYPVGGRKPLPQNRWTEHVMEQRRDWVANTPAEVAELLFDHEIIASVGCGSAMNMPVVVADRVVGTINFLDVPGHFTNERVAAAGTLRLPAAALLMRVQMG